MKAYLWMTGGRWAGYLAVIGSLLLAYGAAAWPYGYGYGYGSGGYEPGGCYRGGYGRSWGYPYQGRCLSTASTWCRPYDGYGGGYLNYHGYGPSYGWSGQGYYSGEGTQYPYPTYSPAYYSYPPELHVFIFPDFGDDPEGWQRNSAWNRLLEGDTIRAIEILTAAERQFPGSGWPKIGVGFIAGINGDYSRALYNFQRGFRFDPSGPGEFPAEPQLIEKARQLADHYRGVLQRSTKKNVEAEFMLAAACYLAGDFEAGVEAADKAIAHGDDSRSTRNLKNLLDRGQSTRVAQSGPP